MKKKLDYLSFLSLLPGLLIAFLVACISKLVASLFPLLGAATIAILLGIFLGNTLLKLPILEKGTKLAESKLLELSIVLLGTTVTFQTIMQIGVKGVIFIGFQLCLTIIAAYIIGMRMHFSQTMSLLMAGGNAVCGSSAIAAIAPTIQAKEEEKGQIITLVNLLGTVLMLLLPLISSLTFGANNLAKSALVGGVLQSVGQVVASASMINGTVVQLAMLFKIMRIMLLVVVVYVFGRLTQGKKDSEIKKQEDKTGTSITIPWYIIGFSLLCVLNSLFSVPTFFAQTAHFFSNWFEIIALAAIGLRLDFKKFMKEGKRFFTYGFLVGLIQVILALLLISILSI